MKKLALILAAFFCMSPLACAQNQNQDQNVNLEQAKQDYRLFLQQLKQLNSQYKEVTSQMQQVIKEEGVPTWDMGEGLTEAPDQQQTPGTFADADIKETDTNIIVKMDLPGVQKDKISVRIQDFKILRVKGEREAEKIQNKTTKGAGYSLVERQHGAFERVIELPSMVDDKTPKAQYENGVLTITLKKVEPKKEVTVPIQ